MVFIPFQDGLTFLNTMDLDSKISFVGGWLLTTISSISVIGLFQAALVGLIGGFFGLVGKELYYYLKRKLK